MMPSLDLNWIPLRYRKGIPTPRIIYTEAVGYAGRFIHPTKESCFVESLNLDLKDGPILEIVEDQEEYMQATIAHEFRHMWQFYSGWDFEPSLWDSSITLEGYKQGIIKYFQTYKSEMDALKFEIKYAPCDCNLEWGEWLKIMPL